MSLFCYLRSTSIAASLVLISTSSPPALAQDDSGATIDSSALEEIVVTGRKREESLIDVPVAISVWTADSLAEQGIVTQQDLFDATVSLTMDTGGAERTGVQPGIRGVQSELPAANRQMVSSFIDGQPMQGGTGNLQFQGIEAVEVYRGPQSAAFGRSTFAGAINYVTADSEDEFSGQVRAKLSDLGDQEVGVMLTGPLGDSLGYRLSYLKSEWTGADEWTSTDGFDMSTQETDQFQGKLNFQFSDSVYGEVMYTRLETSDRPGTSFVMDPALCQGDSGIFRTLGTSSIELPSGAWDCDPSVPEAGVPRNHDVLGQFLSQYDDNIGFYTAAAIGADANMDGVVSSDEYLAQTLADGKTYEQALLNDTVDNPISDVVRNRLQGELNFDVGDNLLQVMGMYVDETSNAWRDLGSDTLAVFSISMRTMLASVNGNVGSRGQDSDTGEKYAEVRWISPVENRLRYTLAGSWYDYSLNNAIFNDLGATVYGLTLPDGTPVDPDQVPLISEVASNIGVSISAQYDLTDRTTLSFEGRYQVDELCGIDLNGANIEVCQDTKAFLPRFAINTALSDNHSVYGQFSIGNNPAGVNTALADPGTVLALQVASGQIASPNDGFIYDGSDGVHFSTVSYDADTFAHFEEEKLYNFEIGGKGTYADGRGSYAGAVYYMKRTDMLERERIDWNDTNPNGWNEDNWTTNTRDLIWLNNGDAEYYGIEFETNYAVNDIWTVGGYLTLSSAKYTDLCSFDAPQYRDAPGGAAGGGNFLLPILSQDNGDDVLADCGVVDGNTLPRQSDVTGNLNIRASLPNQVFGLRTSFRADVRYTGPYYTDTMNLFERKAVATLNLSANMRNENWGLRFYINNVTDNDEPRQVGTGTFYTNNVNPTVVPLQQGGFSITPARPREIGVQVDYNF